MTVENLKELLKSLEERLVVRTVPPPPTGRMSIWDIRCPRCWGYYRFGESKGSLCRTCSGARDKEQGLSDTIRTS